MGCTRRTARRQPSCGDGLYDPPIQADWTQRDGTLGYPGYTVASTVKNHLLEGAGVYVFNQNNPQIVTANGFSAPQTHAPLRGIAIGKGTVRRVEVFLMDRGDVV